MAFTIDIKGTNNLEKSIESAADSLERLGEREEKVNGITKKLGDSLNKNAKKQIDSGKKKLKDEKQNNIEIAKGVKYVAGMAAALVASVGAAAALAYKIADIGKSAFDARRNSAALVSAFTDHKGGVETLAKLDAMAKTLGQTVEETRSKFVDYRAAGFTTKESAALLKTRADLMAVGLSAEEADKELGRVVSSADRMGNVVSHRLLAEIQGAYGGIGSGAKAARHALVSVTAAQNKLSDAFTDVKADFWKNIAPDIGAAAHRLADFTTEFLKSGDGRIIISQLTEAFKDFAKAVNSENLGKAFGAMKATADAIRISFQAAAKAVNYISDKFGENSNAKTVGDNTVLSDGASVVGGFIKGIDSKIMEADRAIVDFAKRISNSFKDELQIKSPSKVFAGYGENTVAGFVKGEESALAGQEMPLQKAAAEAPAMVMSQPAPAREPRAAPNIVLHMNFTGQKDAQEIARTVRDEIQKLLQAGALSQGYA